MSIGDLRNEVALFARSLMSTDVVERFSEARQRFETDAEMAQSREASSGPQQPNSHAPIELESSSAHL